MAHKYAGTYVNTFMLLMKKHLGMEVMIFMGYNTEDDKIRVNRYYTLFLLRLHHVVNELFIGLKLLLMKGRQVF